MHTFRRNEALYCSIIVLVNMFTRSFFTVAAAASLERGVDIPKYGFEKQHHAHSIHIHTHTHTHNPFVGSARVDTRVVK